MSDDLKEKKLAAARLKLRKYQKKKGERSKLSISRESTPDSDEHLLSSGKSEVSSKSSSVVDVNEAVKTEIDLNLKVTEPNSSSYEINSTKVDKIMDQNSQANAIKSNFFASNDNKTESVFENNILSRDFLITNVLEHDHSAVDDLEDSVSSETNISFSTVIPADDHLHLLPVYSEGTVKSTTESLRQLSLQMSGLVNDGNEIEPSGPQFAISELENRNSELAALLSTEKQMNMQQTQLIEEFRTRLTVQDSQIQALQSMAMAANNDIEVIGLREQLQVHIQTIGILVAEKSDLQSTLANTRHSLEQRSGEVTELQGRLEASRHRIRDLESTVQKLKIESSAISASKESDSQQLNLLQSSHSKLSKMCEELRSSVAELSERLTLKSEENNKLSSEVIELRNDLDLSQIRIHQLNDESQEEFHMQFQNLQTAYQESQKEVLLSNETAEKVLNERLQLEEQYKAYVSELSTEIEGLKVTLASSLQSKQDLELCKSEIEEKLKMEEAKMCQMTTLTDFEAEKSTLLNSIEKYKEDYIKLEERCASLVHDNGQLSQLLSEQGAQLEAMENAADRNSFNKVDTTQLLQTMQSDKIAASRALTQNKQLKEQLEELQNGFIMMSNKKLELTEKLEKELHVKKALHQEVARLSEEITSQKEELLRKKRETEKLSSRLQSQNNYAANVEKYLSGGVVDQSSINGHSVVTDETCSTCKQHQLPDEETSVADHSYQQENEISLQNGFPKDSEGGGPLKGIRDDERNSLPDDGIEGATLSQNKVVTDEFSEVSLRTAHEALEKRFSKCMQDLAVACDEKQSLEHLVQQLQIETETVGDYITIYQFQRGVMKQQVQEMKSELDLMKVEKEETMGRISKLQSLFTSLTNDDVTHEGVLSGIKNIFENSTSAAEEKPSEEKNKKDDTFNPNESAGTPPPPPHHLRHQENETKRNKKETVNQIINLINEMESSNQLDFTALHRFHPCSHCLGKLMTI